MLLRPCFGSADDGASKEFCRVRTGSRPSAFGRGCVKTQNRPLEIVSKLGKFSVEVVCLVTWRYRLVSQSIACHVVFEGDFWGEIVAEF